MVAPYDVVGDSFRAEKPVLWAEPRFVARPRTGPTRSFDLHPDGTRVALAPASEAPAATRQDRLIFVSNVFDELLRVVPEKK